MSEDATEFRVGSLWRVRRNIEIYKQQYRCTLIENSYGMIAKVEKTPFYRVNGKAVDRWTITFISADDLAVIRKVSEATWRFYFEEVEKSQT